MAKKEYSEEIQTSLKKIISDFDEEDKVTRDRQIREWKKLEYYWNGFQDIYWDSNAKDWRIPDENLDLDDGGQSAVYYKPVNVFRAYLESIIAALSATVPPIKCFPDDALNSNDVLTAKGGTKIAKLVYEHVNAELLWCKALYVYCTQGMVAAYNYSHSDKSYGTVPKDDYKEVEEDIKRAYCPSCGKLLAEDELGIAQLLANQDEDEFRPEPNQPVDELQEKGPICPQCMMMINPDIRDEKLKVRKFIGVTNQPKARQCIEINGGLYVKVPNWARDQADIPYLAYCYETHFVNVFSKYPHLRDSLKPNANNIASSDGNDFFDRWGRLSPQYHDQQPINTPTCRNWWLRPCAFEAEPDDKLRDKLLEEFPDGVKVVLVNEHWAEACPEDLDDYWTLTKNPLSNYLHFDPLGTLLTSIQEITNDLLSLTLQTIEHGIPQTFASPSVLNFSQYKQMEAAPGQIIPTKPMSGKAVGEGFHTVQTASLGQEVQPFGEKVQELGQFVSGALPSLFGGAMPSSSRTAAQYSMSRNQALQRLQTTWKMFNNWWKEIFGKVIPAYIDSMLDDERIVREIGNNFENLVIKKAELEGKIGSVHIESNEELPRTWSQIRDMVMELIQLNNPDILQLLASPENLDVMQRVFGPTGLKVPNEADRDKQLEEIEQLLKEEPLMTEAGPIPSVMPEERVDNHIVESEICRQWLVGEAGRQAKKDNDKGYNNVLLHKEMHDLFGAMMAPVLPPEGEANVTGNPESAPVIG